jgi:Bacteriocin-protection, YdeI or OmpD-Associated
MTQTMTFTAVARARSRGGITVPLPFDPASVWGERDRYCLAGWIEHYPMRAVVAGGSAEPVMELGPSWCRDPRVGAGATLSVRLHPEGPQLETISLDLADAIRADPTARRFFETLATHYRKDFVRWVDSAKRPETRSRRISEVVAALTAGRHERA